MSSRVLYPAAVVTPPSQALAGRRRGTIVSVARIWIFLLLAGACALLLRTPIVGWDTDLWYHLGHGRYLYEQGEIPNTSYFSFLSPERDFVDYYWLFQALVYPLFLGGGYHGLIILRAALYGATLALMALFLLRGRSHPAAVGLVAFIVSLELIVVGDRYLVLRPHTVSYLALAIFLYVLEHRRSWAPVLPFIAVLWVNAHGVEYPVMVLVCLAYIVDIYAGRRRSGGAAEPRDLRTLAALGLCLAAVFATPHGSRLLAVPFTSTAFAAEYIVELAPPALDDFLAFEVSAAGFSHQTAFNLLGLFAVVAAVSLLWRRRARLGHLLLLAGALGLLVRSERFQLEFVLLTLPLLASALPRFRGSWSADRLRMPATVVFLGLSLIGALSLQQVIPGKEWAYPLAGVRLPQGTVRYLDSLEASGAVMNHPNHGGYLLWALDPRYEIFMEMEEPFLFTDVDMYRASSFFVDAEVLAAVLAEHRPPFIAAHIELPDFAPLIRAHPDYAPVFFDNATVLYADRSQVRGLEPLIHVDPYALRDRSLPETSPEASAGLLRELLAVLEVAPAVDAANQAAAILLNRRGEFGRALGHAEAILASSPSISQGHLIRGDALSGLGRIDEALISYRRAARLAEDAEEERQAHRALAIAYSRSGASRKAYRSLVKAMGLFDTRASFLELQNLASLALERGDLEVALTIYRFARLKVPEKEAAWRQRLDDVIADLEGISR